MIMFSKLVSEIVLTATTPMIVFALITKRVADSIRWNLQAVVMLLFALLLFAPPLLFAPLLGGCVMTAKVVVPDHRTDAKGNITYYGELPERLLTENDCIGARAAGAPCMAPTQEEVEEFPAKKLAWTEAHTKEVPMWGCTFFDWGTTGVAILYYGAVETNPLGLVFALTEGAVVNKIAANHAANGDGSMAKMSAAVHCGAGIWNLGQIAKVAL